MSNKVTLTILWSIAVTMLGVGFYFDEIYDKFCKITGYGGTTSRAEQNDTEILDRTVRVYFDANVNHDLAWEFKPEQTYMDVKLGQTAIAYYEAKNYSDKPIVGTATFNVTPIKAAPYFVKIECFCFQEQLLAPGESMSMPVQFFVEPVMDEESRYDDVKKFTLSYKFFNKENPENYDLSETAAQGRATMN